MHFTEIGPNCTIPFIYIHIHAICQLYTHEKRPHRQFNARDKDPAQCKACDKRTLQLKRTLKKGPVVSAGGPFVRFLL